MDMNATRLVSISLLVGFVAVTAKPAAAETDAEWKPTVFNKISKCRSLWIGLGDVPGDSNAATRDTTFVCHPRFVLSHDNATKTPDWVIERLTKAQVSGHNDRPNKKFGPEPHVPPRGRAVDKDYPPRESGFARGHMAPSEDFNSSAAAMKDTFVLSNAVPQVGARFNGSIWATLEDEVRKAAKARGDIYVITGPVRGTATARSRTIAQADNGCGKKIDLDGPQQVQFCAANNQNSGVACTKGVGVPIALFKIIYDPKQGTAYAFVLPNKEHPSKTDDEARPYLAGFRVTVAAIEGVTGLKFFRELAAAKQEKAVKQCAADNLWAP
jgi:endonuclease G